MQLRFISGLIVSLGLSYGVGALLAQAQFPDAKVNAFVEALRQAAPQTGRTDDGLYSDWQVQAQNIPRWSKACTGKELTPNQFEASPATARGIVICVTRDVLQDEYRTSGNNESLAVRRTAAWWMTGDPNRYNNGDTATYTQKVLSFYQQQSQSSPVKPAPTQSKTQTTAYDRYMVSGYNATKQKDYQTALIYFKRALDERPDDSYALQAIQNIKSYSDDKGTNNPVTRPTSTTAAAAAMTQQQAVNLISQWLKAKAEIFAPPFNQTRISELTTGELQTALINPNGLLDWLKKNQAYYRYGVQKIDSVTRFAASQDRATIELNVTEDRTLYQRGTIDPQHTDFSAKQIRYSLERVDGRWKIADYKTIDGFLLERSILNTTSTNRR